MSETTTTTAPVATEAAPSNAADIVAPVSVSGHTVEIAPLGPNHKNAVIEKYRALQKEAKARGETMIAGESGLEAVKLDDKAPAAEPDEGDAQADTTEVVAAPTETDTTPPQDDEHAVTLERYKELVKKVEAEQGQLATQREKLDYLDALEVDFRIAPGRAIADFARKAAGEDDAAFREYVADAISELTALSLDAKLDTDTRVRQLDRKVRENEKLSKLHQVKLEQEAKERAFRQEVDASRTMVAQALGSLTNEYPHLLAEEDAANMIVSIGEREYKETGKARNWQQIAAALNKDLETKHAAKLSRLEKLKGQKPAPQNTTSETKSDTAKSVPRTLGTKAASEPAATPSERRATSYDDHKQKVLEKYRQQQRMTTT